MTTNVRVDRSGVGALRLTFDGPASKNALDYGGFLAVARGLDSARDDPSVRVVVMTGVGDSFCSGVDLRWALEMRSHGVSPPELMDAANSAVRAVLNCPVPVIARVTGSAAGGGASLAFAADICYATADSRFSMAFTNLDLMPDCGATRTVAAAIGRARAAHLALLGRSLTAEDAADAGLIAEVLAPDELDPQIDVVVRRFLSGSRRATELTKRAVNAGALPFLEESLELERAGQVELLSSPEFAQAALSVLNRPKTIPSADGSASEARA
jgi:enoyl-CoA hydratase/carnithine racemase